MSLIQDVRADHYRIPLPTALSDSTHGTIVGFELSPSLKPLEAFRTHFLDGTTFVDGDTPSIADIRWAATLEFLRGIDYEFPAWAEDYMTRVESALGNAYSEPVADVRGYVESVKAPAV